ncbi:hypothetical protein [Nonomuraea sp. NPDC049400]|uniref:hypothetical protein n=1 Tax=Nonomuraea sp. NPDC049400 TaxID=3364352 RepID=UPI0037A375B8
MRHIPADEPRSAGSHRRLDVRLPGRLRPLGHAVQPRLRRQRPRHAGLQRPLRAALVASLVTTGGSVAATWACLFVTVAGLGTALPATTTIVQSLGHDAPGAASGLLGGSQFILGAAASPLSGLLGDGTISMAVIMLAAFGLAALSLILARGAGRRAARAGQTPGPGAGTPGG